MTKRAGISQELESITLRLRHSILSALLLLCVVILLSLRMFLWGWQTQREVVQDRRPGRFLWFDRTFLSVLLLLVPYRCVSRILLDLPSVLLLN